MRNVCVLLLSVLILCSSCSSFSKLAKQNKFKNDDSFVVYYNEEVPVMSPTFGDFQFANNSKEFKKLNNRKRPLFDHVLLYAKTTIQPAYEYYILLNSNVKAKPGFILQQTTVNDHTITLAISENAPQEDIKIIASQIKER